MNVKEIIKIAKYKTNTSDNWGNYDQDFILPQLNFVYKRIWRKLSTWTGKYFRTSWTTDIIKDQNEYTLDWTYFQWMRKLLWVEILNNGEYSRLEELSELQTEKEWWVLKNNSIFLYPIPKEDSADGIKVFWIQTIPDLTLESTEDDIFPWHSQLRDIHSVLASGLMVELWEGKEDFDKAEREKIKFESLLHEVVYDLMSRVPSASYSSLEY